MLRSSLGPVPSVQPSPRQRRPSPFQVAGTIDQADSVNPRRSCTIGPEHHRRNGQTNFVTQVTTSPRNKP